MHNVLPQTIPIQLTSLGMHPVLCGKYLSRKYRAGNPNLAGQHIPYHWIEIDFERLVSICSLVKISNFWSSKIEKNVINSSTKSLISAKIAIIISVIIPRPLVNVWLILYLFDLQKHVNQSCLHSPSATVPFGLNHMVYWAPICKGTQIWTMWFTGCPYARAPRSGCMLTPPFFYVKLTANRDFFLCPHAGRWFLLCMGFQIIFQLSW